MSILTQPSNTAPQRAIDPNLFAWPAAQPALLASRCRDCGAKAFPVNPSCTACGGENLESFELPRRGTLWAWTVQRFMPKSPYHSSETPDTFTPYGVGYIELPGALRIESRLQENDPAVLRSGIAMELVFYVHRTEPDGTEVINYAFKPV